MLALENPRMWWHPSMYSKHLPFIHIPAEVDAETARRLTPLIHCGHNVIPGSFQDRGLAEALESAERLRDWVAMIAREALDMEKLPGIQHPDLTIARLQQFWPTGVYDAAGAPLEKWLGYPHNGLFKHPLTEAGRESAELPAARPQNAA